MILADIPSGATVFLDDNCFVYHFTLHADLAESCTRLIERIEQRDLAGCTSSHILSEVAHRLMTIEASNIFGWPFAGIARRLKRHREEIRNLPLFRDAVEAVLHSPIRVLPISTESRTSPATPRPDATDAAARGSIQI